MAYYSGAYQRGWWRSKGLSRWANSFLSPIHRIGDKCIMDGGTNHLDPHQSQEQGSGKPCLIGEVVERAHCLFIHYVQSVALTRIALVVPIVSEWSCSVHARPHDCGGLSSLKKKCC